MDKALKQRLVGASVLIVLAVIVLPMLLSGRSDTLKQESRQIELPPKPEELSIETRRFPVGLPNQPSSSSQQEDSQPSAQTEGKPDVKATGVNATTKAVTTNQQAPGSTAVEPGGAADAAGDAGTTTGPAPEKPQAVKSITLKSSRDKGVDIESPQEDPILMDGPRYLVQVASFSSEKNANVLATRLRQNNYNVLMDVVERVAGRMHRVRVGPYEDSAEAESVVTDLKAKMSDLKPRVLDLRPDEDAPVSKPSDPLVRWVVQVGSFATEATADALVAKLRLAGLSAFSEKVTSGSNIAYKVRVGPELDRDKAVQLAKTLKADHQLDGFVTTQE